MSAGFFILHHQQTWSSNWQFWYHLWDRYNTKKITGTRIELQSKPFVTLLQPEYFLFNDVLICLLLRKSSVHLSRGPLTHTAEMKGYGNSRKQKAYWFIMSSASWKDYSILHLLISTTGTRAGQKSKKALPYSPVLSVHFRQEKVGKTRYGNFSR